MRSFKAFSDIDEYYKDWSKVIDSKGICYTCPSNIGKGYVQLIGDVNTVFVSIVDYVEYNPILLRSYMTEQTISIAEVASGSAQYYRNKNKISFTESGINCGINALPTVLYSIITDNIHLKSTGLVIRESFLQTLSIQQHDLEQMAYVFNGQQIYDSALLLICKQLRNIPVSDNLIPIYLKAKATEIVSLLMSLIQEMNHKPKLKKGNFENIKLAKKFLDNHYVNPPKVEELASMFYINKNLLQAGFKNFTGRTVYEYISYQKISRAVELLLLTDMTMEAIADSIGYKSKMNFYNAFKREFSKTPNELRRNHKETFRQANNL